jgi:membrane protease YdiL (CAAX protease family)
MTFYILALAILTVFPYCKVSLFRQPLWLYFLLLSLLVAYVEQHINFVGIAIIILYLALYYGALKIKQSITKLLLSAAFIAMALLLALHYLPGFNNLPIIISEQLSEEAITFTLYANLDKGIAGLLLTAYFFKKLSISKITSNYANTLIIGKHSVNNPLLLIMSTIAITLFAAFSVGLVVFNPKVPNFWFEFIAINLLFTCVAEEALFRGVLQTTLSKRLSTAQLPILAPIVSALVFAGAHFMGGTSYVLVSAVAGFGYSYIFYKTQRLEWAI